MGHSLLVKGVHEFTYDVDMPADYWPACKKTNRIMYREAPTGSHVREPPSAAYIIYARARAFRSSIKACLVD